MVFIFAKQQIKRKIEDVSKKLDVLYDCLRENKVCIYLHLMRLYILLLI